MDFNKILANRRSTRFYKSDAVPEEDVKQMLNNAVQSPTARNTQPWAFKAIQDVDIIKGISDESKKYLLSLIDGENSPFFSYKERFEDPDYSLFHNAPLLVIVYATNPDISAAMDCSMAAYTIMLNATNLNLASCWIGLSTPYLKTKDAVNRFALPSVEYVPIAPLAIGYPKFPIDKLPAAEKKPPIIL